MDEVRGTRVSKTPDEVGSTARPQDVSEALASCLDAIAVASTEMDVYESVCAVLAEKLHLPLVWMGLSEPGTRKIVVPAAAGRLAGKMDQTAFPTGAAVSASSIIGLALRTGRPQAIVDLATQPAESPEHVLALNLGVRSAATFPIRTGHIVIGSILCAAEEPAYFSESVVEHLGRVSAAASARLAAIEHASSRHEIERRLTDSERRYQGLFDLSPVAIIVAGRGRLDVNRAFLEMFGFADQAALEAAGPMSIVEAGQEAALQQLMSSLEPDDAAPHILRSVGRRPDGSTFPILIEGVQVELDGYRSGLVFITDLTTLETAEATAHINRTQLSALVERAPLAIISVDLEGIVRSWNPAAAQIFGWTEKEVLGRRAPLETQRRKLMATAVGSLPQMRAYEVSNSRRDGSGVDLRIWSSPLTDAAENPTGTMLIMDDITSQNRLVAERARLAIAIDQASESIVITDTDAAIVYVNPAFEKLTGYTRAEVIGKNPRVLKAGLHGPEHYRSLWSTLGKSETWRGDFVNRRKDGSLFEEEASISPVFDATGKLINYIAVKRDVTRERELERERDRVEARNRQMFSEMLGGMAVHEIICDADGKPVDYRFLDVNPAFEAQTVCVRRTSSARRHSRRCRGWSRNGLRGTEESRSPGSPTSSKTTTRIWIGITGSAPTAPPEASLPCWFRT
jgi:PAS domain S-box-containing protein